MKNRGRAHFILGNFAQAAADLQRGLALDSADAQATLWLHLARRRGGIPRGLVSPEAWLARVLINLARNEWRKQRGRRRLESVHLHEAAVAPAALPEAAAVAKKSLGALACGIYCIRCEAAGDQADLGIYALGKTQVAEVQPGV